MQRVFDHLRNPWSRGVDERARLDFLRRHRPASPAQRPFSRRARDEPRADADRRAALLGVERVEHDEPGVLDPAIGVGETDIVASRKGAPRALPFSETICEPSSRLRRARWS